MALELVNEKMPSLVLEDENNQALPLSEIWSRGPAALLLLRHFG
jgi:hypothetical protein